MSESEAPTPPASTPLPQPPAYEPAPYNPWIDHDEAPRDPTTNGFAIASMVLGLIGGFPLAIVFGAVALIQIDKRNQHGRKYAVTGLIASGVWISIILTVVTFLGDDRADRDSTGRIDREGWVDTRALKAGDCIGEIKASGEVPSLRAVPCAQPHEGEVYGTFELAEGEYPGESAVLAQADQGCGDLLWSYAPDAFEDPTVVVYYLYPHEGTWLSNRTITCIAASLDGTMTGTIAGQAET